VGILSFFHHLPETTSEEELLKLISDLNHDKNVDGILVQLPLPSHMNSEKIIEAIDPKKDVDGFHPINIGKLLLGLKGGFVPCTPLGIKILLERYQIPVVGKDVVIVGRSAIVGKPLAALLMQNAPHCNATVTVVHSQTRDLKAHCARADILVAAIGSPRFITADMVKERAVVVDVGISREESDGGYRLVGDVDFNQVEKKCFAITPVPKGVGPMTVAMLLHNTLLSHQRRFS
jgi:methylenetetrahydrofolate dehydrogenase (NADP+) / methenyltetrahydrofolate cyclohydrolase